MAKLFVFTVSLDEGVSAIWHFRATDKLSIAQYILDNRKDYDDLLGYLPAGKKANELTAATLFVSYRKNCTKKPIYRLAKIIVSYTSACMLRYV